MTRSTKPFLTFFAVAALAVSCSQRVPSDGIHTLHILTTNDVHGAWFDSTYVGSATRNSLLAVNYYVDSVRAACNEDNVLLLDAGDCLQGDNAAYYYNYVNTDEPHIFPRIAKYMGYDAIVVGNHDVETGHAVYDRVRKQLKSYKIPFLAGNTPTPSGKSYFQEYAVFRRAGLKVLVLGYTNANMKAWLGEDIWSGMDFQDLNETVQGRVDAIRAKVKPDVTVVAVHSGVGKGDGSILESQALDLFQSLRGVDVLVSSHDHRPFVQKTDSICIINTGSRAANLGHGIVQLEVKDGQVEARRIGAGLIKVDRRRADSRMRAFFQKDYNQVKAFTMHPVGNLAQTIRTSDAVKGQCFYTDLLHRVQMDAAGASISFAAPLQLGKVIPSGQLVFNDMFTLYPYENALCCMELYGREIIDYLEYSYDLWVRYDGKHALSISSRPDPRYNTTRWSFNNASYNFDSAGGLNYTVNVTEHFGNRVDIKSLANGKAFDPDSLYRVAMTSYRAAGGGDLLIKGAHLEKEELESRTVWRGSKEIREYITEYFESCKEVSPKSLGNVGTWKFTPSPRAQEMIAKDAALVLDK